MLFIVISSRARFFLVSRQYRLARRCGKLISGPGSHGDLSCISASTLSLNISRVARRQSARVLANQ